ncbi:MAG TPA: DUF177 domain-containing protein [Anaerolineales bacterium]|nr:DUF177 domain-containing protein [Anaerolineales bacterium]
MTKRDNPLRINVGFLVKANAGYSRTIEFDVGQMVLSNDLTVNDLRGAARFGRTPQGLVVEVALSGRTNAECARCLDQFELPVATEFTELYAFDERSMTDSQLLVPANHQIDLAPLAREYLLLDEPITPLCRPDCKGLCPVCGANWNREQCAHQDQPPADLRIPSPKDLIDPKD